MPLGLLALLLTSTLLLLALAGVVWSPLLPRRESARYVADARASAASHDTSSHADSEAQAARLGEDYGRLPLQFEINEGQTDPRVNFISRGNGYTLFLTPAEAVLRLPTADCGLRTAAGEGPCGPANRRHETGDTRRGEPAILDTRTGLSAVLRMSLVGADVHAGVAGLEEQQGKSNYLIGRDPSKWRTNVSNYSRVRYTEIYPGVDLEYYGDQRQLEYDFRVASGASLRKIGLAFKGAKNLRIDKESGDLLFEIAGGELRQRRPVIYQEVNGERRDVEGRYAMKGRGVVGFSVADYDHTQPLVIDPVLSYSTFIGTGRSLSVAVDSFGDAYVAGDTTATTFPTTTGALQTTHGASSDAFVTKMNATGTSLIYSTFLGGDSDEQGNGIAVDAKGNAYVALQTDSDDLAVVNGFKNDQPVGDGYLAKLDPKGATLLYSTYLGGNNTDSANAVAVDSAGNAYVAGFAKSSDLLTTPAPASTFHNTLDGSQDAFLVKINTRATGAASFVYGTFLGGGGGADDARSVAVDFAGRAVVCGVTNSSDFPLQSAAQNALDGTSDGFVTKMNASGTAPVFSTYLGGNGTDEADGIAVDAAGNSYVASETASTDFPTAGSPAQPAFGGGTFDIAVTKFTTAGAISYSTFAGGSGNDITPTSGSSCIAVDSHGDAVVTGETTSSNFPVVNASQSALSSGQDMFVTKLNPAGSQFIYSTYLGGNGQDTAAAVALDSFGNAYVVGDTFSANFPTTTGAFDTTSTGFDATVTRLSQLGSCGTVSYTNSTGSPFAVGAQPFSVAVGDFNNDGKQDLVAANSGTTTVSVLMGDGAGGFGAATNFNVGSSPASVAVSDFNGDGKPDIAAANLGSNNVSILLGDGAGGFSAATNFNVGSGPQSLAVGDFNGDGKPDIATANFNTNDVSILLGDGTGGFSAATNFNVDSRPDFLAVGDFNLDGKLDLAVTNSTSNDVSILLGNGTGGFGAAINFPINFNPQSVAVGDFNLDGKLDLAVGKGSQVSVLLGDGTGSFGAETNFTTGGGGASVAVGDFNGDGKPDIATGNFSAANVSILPGDGTGSFGAATNFNAGTDPQSLAVGDFNGDGKPDLAVANFGSNNVSVLLDSCGAPTSNTIVVTNTNDSGAGSLRQAILDSNSTVGTKETITFNIPGAGVHTIQPASALPTITDPVTIDGYTQPGASANTLATGDDAVIEIELDGTNAGSTTSGLVITAGGSTVRGLVINRFGTGGTTSVTAGGTAIEINTGDGNVVEGCFIGTDTTGASSLANINDGVGITSNNNRVGGSTAAQRNVISGNDREGVLLLSFGANNSVLGNYVGTNAAGTAAITNASDIVLFDHANNCRIGGTNAGEGNLIGGSLDTGVLIVNSSHDNTVQGNLIGTNATGTAAIPNQNNGVGIFDTAQNNTVGGTSTSARNIISGNLGSGVRYHSTVTGNVVEGNFIGTDTGGTAALGNGLDGVTIEGGTNLTVGGTTAADANTVAFNTQAGVVVTGGVVVNQIEGNSIHDNGALGIDLGNDGVSPNDTNDEDGGSNNLQNFPVITSATSGGGNTSIQGTLNSAPSATFRIEFFVTATCDASGNGEGQAFLGTSSVTTDASGNATINSNFAVGVADGQVVTATATDPTGNTSEFSACASITLPPPTWTGAVSTDWNTAGNWNTNVVPTSTDAVVIPSTGVTNEPAISSANAVAASVTVQSGRTLTIANNKTLTATTLTIDSGATLHTLSNQTGFVNASVTNNGTVDGVNANSLFDFLGSSFVNNGSVSVGFFRFGASQTLSGTGTFTSSTIEIISGSTVTLASNHTLSNLSVSDGTFDQGASFNLTVGPLTVSSLGTFKNLGTGDLTLSGNVSNGGTIQLNGGGGGCGDADSILIRSSVAGTQRAWTGAGTFSVFDVDVKDQAGTASVNAQSSTDSGNNGANWHFVGCAANNIQWLSAVSGNWSDASKWQDGTGANRVPAAGDDVTINADGTYTVTLDVDATINSLTLGRATSTGTQTLDDPSHTLSLASASSTLSTGIFNLGGTRRGVGTLAVGGTFNWTAGSLADAGTTNIVSAGHLNISSNSDKLLDTHTLNNAGVATWTGTGRILADDGALINNQSGGLFDCQNNSIFNYAGVGAIPTFNNLAGATLRKSVVNGQTTVGNFNFNNAGTLDVQTGDIDFTSGGDTNTFNNGTLITGSGEVLLDSAHLSTNGTVTVNGTFHLGGGQINFNTPAQGTWTGTGAFNWTSGSFNGTGTTNIAAGFHFNITGNSDKLLDTHTLDNAGIITLTGAGRLLGDDGALINNQSGGLFDIQTDTGLAYGGVGPPATFNNLAGATFDKSAGGGNSNISQFSFNNAGAFEIFSGTVVIDQGYTQTAGSTTLEGGNFSTGGNTIALQGGTLTGTGTLTAATLNNSGGTIAPGLSGAGCLAVSGNYTQGASGSLAIEIGGATPCTQFDRLAVTGTATLGGTLSTTLINGFTPAAGQSFQVMTYASETGAFASVTGPFAATVNATNVSITTNAAPATFSISGNVADPASLPLVGVNIHLSGSATRDVTTDAAGNYTFAGLPQGGSFTLTPTQTNFRFTPASAAVNNLLDNVVGVNFSDQFIDHTITGRVVDAQGNPIPGVTVTLAGSFSAVTHTDAQGNFTFTNIPENGNFVVTPEKDGLVFNPAHQSITGVVADTQFQSVGSVQPSPTPTPDQSDDFSGGPDPDPDKWVRGILTNPPPAFDPLVNVFLAGGLLHIQPRADADGLHYNGLVSVRALDLNSTPIASVEVVQASTGAGAQTIFGLGRDSDNWFRFSVVDDSAAPTPTPTPNATPTPTPTPSTTPTPNPSPTPHHSSAKAGAGGDTTSGQTLLFEINVGGRKFSVGIAYDPAQQRFWRFRNDAPAHQIVFETSPDAAVWTEHFRATLPADQAQLIAELSAGTFRPTSAPGEALFDNFLLSPSPQLQFGNSDFNVLESAGTAQVQVIRTGSAESPDSVDFATSDGTAHAGHDYTATSGTLVFGIGERVKTINIPVIDNDDPDGNRTVNITLSNPVGGRLGSIPRAVLTILDDDRPSNPIDDTTFFVTQQYLDFLGRAPDADGLAFWVRNIDSCGADAQCREAKRVDTSAAFFLSIEFQETGYVVDRFYKATFGHPPAFDEYLPDLAVLRDGVIIGQPGAEDRLAANKQLFAEQWVARPAFKQAFDSLNDAQYVDTLSANAGVTLAEQDRTALVVGLLTKRETRAGVLLKIIENEAFVESEFNPAFVRMEYFGYLRRDPDPAGFEFWLSKLDRFGGDFRAAEMVKAFISSTEYRARFGQP
ncbi:MAG TPA: FG-GAP-like repeat-containing protein [Pyrinomonadaceae bacterium]|nr:FG-GAP-like repeat-containing protein [Pyrinomonadaceae bacterium]